MNTHCGKWDSAVHAAVSGGHMNILEFLVSNGADINSQPPLFAYLDQWDTQLLKYLIDHGMKIDMQDEQHTTALHKALSDENYAHFDVLLERGADVNALSEKVGTPLQAACARLVKNYWRMDNSEELGMLRAIGKLLDRGADPNIRGGKYATALQAACSTDHENRADLSIEAVRLLIEYGADVDIQGGHWGFALHAAAASYSEKKVEMMKLLLDNGAKVNQKGNDGETPLHIACYEGTFEAVRFLVDRGADVNAECGRFGTPILAAAARGDNTPGPPKVPILTFLMDKGANINYQGGAYGSALQAHFHSYFEHIESLRFLLKHCPDVNAKGGKYGTALIAACAYRHARYRKECVRLLLDHGADVNAQSGEYGTALIAACQPHDDGYKKDTEIVQWLLECSADVNAQGGKYGTALSAVCNWNFYEVAELLLNHGANLHLKDCAAWYSAISAIATRGKHSWWAADGEDEAVVLELLVNRGMDVNHGHAEYGTALHAMMNAEPASAAWHRGIDVLLKHRINPNIVSEKLGSALHRACAIEHEGVHAYFDNGCLDCKTINCSSSKAAYLLEKCPDMNVNAKGGTFNTALQAAAYSGQTLSVRMLLDRKARVNARGGKYHSALNGAIISGHWNIVKILLAAGATADCHLQGQPDEDWLRAVLEEDGRGAVERYRKFWEVELEKKKGGGEASNS